LVLIDSEIEDAPDLLRVFGSRGGGPGALLLAPSELSGDPPTVESLGADGVLGKSAGDVDVVAAAKKVMDKPHQSPLAATEQVAEIWSAQDIFAEVIQEIEGAGPPLPKPVMGREATNEISADPSPVETVGEVTESSVRREETVESSPPPIPEFPATDDEEILSMVASIGPAEPGERIEVALPPDKLGELESGSDNQPQTKRQASVELSSETETVSASNEPGQLNTAQEDSPAGKESLVGVASGNEEDQFEESQEHAELRVVAESSIPVVEAPSTDEPKEKELGTTGESDQVRASGDRHLPALGEPAEINEAEVAVDTVVDNDDPHTVPPEVVESEDLDFVTVPEGEPKSSSADDLPPVVVDAEEYEDSDFVTVPEGEPESLSADDLPPIVVDAEEYEDSDFVTVPEGEPESLSADDLPPIVVDAEEYEDSDFVTVPEGEPESLNADDLRPVAVDGKEIDDLDVALSQTDELGASDSDDTFSPSPWLLGGRSETTEWRRFWLGVAAGLAVFTVTMFALWMIFGGPQVAVTGAAGGLQQEPVKVEVTPASEPLMSDHEVRLSLEELVDLELGRREAELRRALLEEERRLQKQLDELGAGDGTTGSGG
jgi:hypothetical protein